MIAEVEIEGILKLAEENPQRLAAKCIKLMMENQKIKDEQIAWERYMSEKTGNHLRMYYNYVVENAEDIKEE